MTGMKKIGKDKNRKLIRYRFADELLSTDTKISFVAGLIAAVLLIASIVIGIVKKGEAGDVTGMMLGIALVMSVTGIIFGGLSFRDVTGSNNGKRYAVELSVIVLIALVILMVI
ncbi:MAG: hypothetical protein IJ619_11170 [Eubacterium sp.]|nr:hypothetical protein [Eubacterium sp.]